MNASNVDHVGRVTSLPVMRPSELIRHGLLAATLLSACGTVQQGDGSPDGGLGNDTGDGGGGAGDAAPPDLLSVFYTSPVGDTAPLFVSDVVDGAVMEGTPLSGTLGHASAGANRLYLARDGRTAVFTADIEEEGQFELYLSRHDGGQWPAEPVRLSGDPGVLALKRAFLEPDGSGLVYGIGSVAWFTVEQYYFVDLSGEAPGQPVPFGAGAGGLGEQLSADGSTFAYVQDGEAWVVDLTGSSIAPVRVSQTPAGSGGVSALALAADGSKIAFAGDLVTDGVQELWVVELGGASPGTPRKASGALVSGGDVATGISGAMHYFSPDGRKLVFLADKTTEGVNELFIVDVADGTPGPAARVNGPPVSGGAVGDTISHGWGASSRFSPDGRWIAYAADQRVDDVIELFVVDVSGSSPTGRQRVSGDLAAGGAVGWFWFAPDSSGLAYTADQEVDEVRQLYYIDLRSGAPAAAARVNGDLVTGGDVAFPTAYLQPFSPDGRSIAYAADQRVDEREEVFLVRIADGVPAPAEPVQEPIRDDTGIQGIEFAADGSTLVFRGTTMAPTSEAWIADTGAQIATRLDASSEFWLWP